MAWESHSHSIVSGTRNQLKAEDFLSCHVNFTVRSTDKQFRLEAIDGDRRRATQSRCSGPQSLLTACLASRSERGLLESIHAQFIGS